MSDAPFLDCLWTNLAEILCNFDDTLGQNSTNVSSKYVHRWLSRKGAGQKHEPKLKGWTLTICCLPFIPMVMFVIYYTTRYSLPESEQDLHDAVEVADVPRLLRGPQDAAEDGAARGRVARLRDHQMHDPLAHLTER